MLNSVKMIVQYRVDARKESARVTGPFYSR